MHTETDCPSSDELAQLAEGTLPEPRCDWLLAHLEGCPRCLYAVETADYPSLFSQTFGLIAGEEHLPGAAALIDSAVARGQALWTERGHQSVLPYRLLECLGEGSSGSVYRAVQVQLNQFVALKLLKPSVAANAICRRQFLDAARALSTTHCEHLVSTYSASDSANGPYLIMELLAGETLATRLAREGPLPAREVARVGRAVAAGLATLHALGWVHTGVRPQNIWLAAQTGQVKLLDICPQQDRRNLHADEDLVALGSTLYEAATGRPPLPERQRLDRRLPRWLVSAIDRLLTRTTPTALAASADLTPGWLAARWPWLLALLVVGVAIGISAGMRSAPPAPNSEPEPPTNERPLSPDERMEQVAQALRTRNPHGRVAVRFRHEHGHIVGLTLIASGLSDLGPVAELTTLQEFDFQAIGPSPLSDLQALAQLPLRKLILRHHPQLCDLTPCARMGLLRDVTILSCGVTDLAPLTQLERLTTDLPHERVVPFVRTLPTLKIINEQAADAYRAQHDKN